MTTTYTTNLINAIAASVRTFASTTSSSSSSSTNAPASVFEVLERHFVPPLNPSTRVQTLWSLKEHPNENQYKGGMWEEFCRWYLLFTNERTNEASVASARTNEGSAAKYDVWTLKTVPDNIRTLLHLSHQDFGIDLVVCRRDGTTNAPRFIAVQCKYRSPTYDRFKRKVHRVRWQDLSTFLSLVTRTGPFEEHVVITNAESVSWKGKKTRKDVTIARSTFQSLDIEWWTQFQRYIAVQSTQHSFDVFSRSLSMSLGNTNAPSNTPQRALRRSWLDRLSKSLTSPTTPTE